MMSHVSCGTIAIHPKQPLPAPVDFHHRLWHHLMHPKSKKRKEKKKKRQMDTAQEQLNTMKQIYDPQIRIQPCTSTPIDQCNISHNKIVYYQDPTQSSSHDVVLED
jgi:hypothetical protein